MQELLQWQWTPFAVFLCVTTAIGGCLTFIEARRPVKHRISYPLIVLGIIISGWCLTYALEIASAGFSSKVMWAKVQYLFISAMGPTWLLLAVCYRGWNHRWVVFGYCLTLPFIALIFTNEQHQFFWQSIELKQFGAVTLLVFEHGDGFWLFYAITYAMLGIAMLLLGVATLGFSDKYRAHKFLVLASLLLPIAGNVLYVFQPFGEIVFDLTPLFFMPFLLAMTVPVKGHHIAEALPTFGSEVLKFLEDPFFLADANGKVFDRNAAGEKLLKRDISGGGSISVGSLPGIDDQDWLDGAFVSGQEVRLDDETYVLTVRSMAALGYTETFAISYKPVTELRDILGKLNKQQDRYQHLLDHANDYIFIIDESANFEAVSASLLRFLNRDINDLLTTPVENIVHPLDRPDFSDLLAVNSVDMIDYREVRLVSQDLEVARVRLQVIPLVDEGVLSYQCIAHDITQDYQQEEELKATRKEAEDALSLKSKFMTNISHEIRTPLNGIIGMSQLLLETKLDEHQLEKFNTLQRSAQALSKIVDDILDFAKIESGGISLQEKRFAVIRTLQDLVFSYLDGATVKGIDLGLEIKPEVSAYIFADEVKFRLIAQCLIDNALKFTSEGEVSVTLDVEHEGDDDILVLEVRDTGIGISEADKLHIFEVFSQVDMSLDRPYEGTGIGLSLCTRMIEIMNGTLQVDSAPGKGSCFCARLPFLPVQEEHSLQMSEVDGRQVLVVEDNLVNQEVARGLLNSLGLECLVASNGKEAISMLQVCQVDLILMDLQMPVLDGFSATEHIRALPNESARVPIVAMTASVTEEDRRKCFKVKMNDHISKPISLDQLVPVLERYLPVASAQLDASNSLIS